MDPLNAPPARPAPASGRDTLTFALGALADAMIRRAIRQPATARHYRAWLACTERGAVEAAAEPLASAGVAEGSATLFARPRPGHFLLDCQHDAFDARVAIGYDMLSEQLNSLMVAAFEGDAERASAFALTLVRQVRGGDLAK